VGHAVCPFTIKVMAATFSRVQMRSNIATGNCELLVLHHQLGWDEGKGSWSSRTAAAVGTLQGAGDLLGP
jgi:hypothetical protein